MGNCVSCSCTLAAGAIGSGASSIQIIFPGGAEARHIDGPATVAEIMLDAPGHFLVRARSLGVGRRLVPLPADKNLEAGEVYVMLPMRRANAIITSADVAALASPDAAAPVQAAPLDAPESEVYGMWSRGLRTCRSRRPALDTIDEEDKPQEKIEKLYM
ncbi:uncharacterized protein LOC141825349 [Curcuma longa]|uniref:uncharacterized protein LOC141825349 n=1 Tax=Curcuma longa TaxID=136217 RepID=UPI003D9E6A90